MAVQVLSILMNQILLKDLHLACKEGDYESVKTHLNHADGCDVNKIDSHGITPLMYASLYGHTDIVRLLLNSGADVNMQDNDGWSALMAASRNGHTNVIKILVEKGADMNLQKKDGWSALMAASQNGHSHVVKVLIEKGAQVNMQMNNGLSALMIACENGNYDVVEVLIEKGAQINLQKKGGWSALMLACYRGKKEVVQILLDHHVDTSTQATDGKTAFTCAHNTEIVKLLSCEHKNTTSNNSQGIAATPLATDEAPQTTDRSSYLKPLRSALIDVRAEWRDLGIELGITVGTCDVIAEENSGKTKRVDNCFTGMLEEWLKSGPQLEDLFTALESPFIRRADIAKDLKGNIASKELVLW